LYDYRQRKEEVVVSELGGRAGIRPRVRGAARTAQGLETLVERVSDTLRQTIFSGQFPPGSRLPSEAQLTAAHGVSRTVVREAIAALRADRLVESRQGAGVFVLGAPPWPPVSLQGIDPERVSSAIELLELRTGVEVEAAGLAALRRSPAQEEAILDRHVAVHEALEAGRSSSEADFALHLAIAEATNNPQFHKFLTLLGESAIPRAALKSEGPEKDSIYLKLLYEEHNRIVVAISNGDETAAREAMHAHLRGSQARYRALLRGRRKLIV
jgi:GntR family transcriptional regulator, transcriptional repressor for pyruvate dehydrogenase complex